MKLLVSTKETQGQRKSDFSHVPEGEIVNFAFECDTDRGNIDGVCGCRRSMSGIECNTATTTMKVVEVAAEQEPEILGKIRKHYEEGWHRTPKEAAEEAQEDLEELKKIGEFFPLGAIIEKRGKTFQVRQPKGEKA